MSKKKAKKKVARKSAKSVSSRSASTKSLNGKAGVRAKISHPGGAVGGAEEGAGDGWPNKRNIFFRPGRMKYVRKLVKEVGCVFCTSAQSAPTPETLCVYKTKYSQIILNKYPYNNGHLLVLPLSHTGKILELDSEAYLDLHLTLKLGIEALNAVYQPQGFNVGMNHGESGGAGIPYHLHYHLVPRWSGDLNFFPLIANTKIVIESLESSYEKFKAYFDARFS